MIINKHFFGLMLCLSFLFAHGQQKVIELPLGSKKLLVRIIEPEGFSPDKAYPILLGPGLDGGNLNTGCRFFGSNAEKYGWILIESLVHMEKRAVVKVLVEYLKKEYKVNELFILGFSANSIDAFQIASTYNHLFTGVIGMPGNPNISNLTTLKRLVNTKVLMIVGEKDVYWKNRAKKAKEIMDSHKIKNTLVVIPNGGHILDELAGKPLFDLLGKMISSKTNQ
ncbi:hypothetical protein [Flagellimonas sp. S3867]|uniref:hypothetical protein n=1 Tax=Flagellimonas sp. S3867 TaxID=2768063 RepID=UPI00168276D6|nr:hypothetical protein [Flagellimonas sp. S3867]